MASTMPEIAIDASPFLRIYKDGRVERLMGTDNVPPSFDPKTNVESKDVPYSPESNLSARLFIPKDTSPVEKLPLLVYFHGGAFCVDTAFSPTYHDYVNTLAAEAKVIAISVDYRKAPEHPVPVAYDDSWTALKWIASHLDGNGPEDWVNRHVDFRKFFLAGDSAGANIAHRMGIKIGQDQLEGVSITGIILVHPFFWGRNPVGAEINDLSERRKIRGLWRLVCPTTNGYDDPWINPGNDPNLKNLGCTRLLVFVAEMDVLRHRGWYYYEELKKSGWRGEVEIMESSGEDHGFHLLNPTSENAMAMLKRIVSFMIQERDKFIKDDDDRTSFTNYS
ncbi:probable carboxylesterase 7 [Durio zibethinus]|uniref:Probable carboxylesterase 7 n=1 Tax=Durio zibethinus TaxID=66656 RepID=A0A6P5XF04_DURZI|nr:probable carboxylesterase 7 [Durio zibethinus]